jgi:hypothetical protein
VWSPHGCSLVYSIISKFFLHACATVAFALRTVADAVRTRTKNLYIRYVRLQTLLAVKGSPAWRMARSNHVPTCSCGKPPLKVSPLLRWFEQIDPPAPFVMIYYRTFLRFSKGLNLTLFTCLQANLQLMYSVKCAQLLLCTCGVLDGAYASRIYANKYEQKYSHGNFGLSRG